MNEEVRKAAETIDSFFANRARGLTVAADINMHDWLAIRAELTRLTEIADAVDPLVVRLGEVTTRLEAADALLREVDDWGGLGGSDIDRPIAHRLNDRIQSHLQGAGDEA